MNKIDAVTQAIDHAIHGQTKLNVKALNMEGMSSPKVRNFLNKLLETPESRYLEIGVWRGSTFYSALYGNNPIYATSIDNFATFGGHETIFRNNMNDVGVPYEFINDDCFNLKNKLDKKYNIYFYDGEHYENDQEKALTYYYDNLDDEFIYICDDWNFPSVPIGTANGLAKTNLKVIQEWTLESKHNGDTENWWNGLWIAVLRK